MLRRILPIFFVLLSVFISQSADAQWIVGTDTAYANKIVSFNISDTAFLNGAPDNRFATFERGDEAYVSFSIPQKGPYDYPIRPGATVIVYGLPQPGTTAEDSSGVFLTFEGAASSIPSERFYLSDTVNVITVPNEMYTSITLTNTYQPQSGDIVYLDTFYVDAIKLVQSFENLSVARLTLGHITAAFPNPFSTDRGTRLEFTTERASDISVLIMDIAGREVMKLDVGPRPSGEQTVQLLIPDQGFYFAQLLLDGVPSGKMFRLSVQ
jgi:hypothetical protein